MDNAADNAADGKIVIDVLWLAQVATAAWVDVSFAGVVGALLCGIWLRAAARGAAVMSSPARRALARVRGFGLGCAVSWLAADLLTLWLQAAVMAGLPVAQAGQALWPVLTESHFGLGWAVGGAAALVLTLALVPARALTHRGTLSVALLAAAAGAYAKAATGHAADAGAFALPEWIQALHIASTAAWAGLVLTAALAVLPALAQSSARGALLGFVKYLSNGAACAVVLLVASGIFNAMRGLGDSWTPLLQSAWGVMLLVKLTLVALALLLGGVNRCATLPRLRRGASTDAAHAFRRLIVIEAGVLVVVLCVAAALAHSAPGWHVLS